MSAEHGHLKELTTAFFGNYTLQDLLDATHKMRQAAAKLRARNTASISDIGHMLGFSDGQDSLSTSPATLLLTLPGLCKLTEPMEFMICGNTLHICMVPASSSLSCMIMQCCWQGAL